MVEVNPRVLIVANRYDFASDYIAAILSEKGFPFLRLNSDDLSNLEISMHPTNIEINIWMDGVRYVLNETHLRSIYFRAPTFLRETSIYDLTTEEKLSKTQWASFTRSLMIFSNCKWVNHPMHTYYAENKPVQLALANRIGFDIPKTIVTNTAKEINSISPEQQKIILKGADTVFINVGDDLHAFTYTTIISKNELLKAELSDAPMIIQELLEPKIDLRVTVVGKKVFAVEVLENDEGITGDWRLRKEQVVYIPVDIPLEIKDKCIELVGILGLYYGAIDLARVNDIYYFIEINPTGEWAWLLDQAELRIDEAITSLLITDGDDSTLKKLG